MTGRNKAQIAIAVAVVALAVARFLSDGGGDTSRKVVLTGVLVGLLLVVAMVFVALRLVGSRRRGQLPLLAEVRATGATAFVCMLSQGTEYGVIAVGTDGRLTLSLGRPGRTRDTTLAPGDYTLQEGPVPMRVPGEVPGLQVLEHGSITHTLLVFAGGPDSGRPRGGERTREHEARVALIEAAGSPARS